MNWLNIASRRKPKIAVFPGNALTPIAEARTWIKLFHGRISVRCPCCDRVVQARKPRSTA